MSARTARSILALLVIFAIGGVAVAKLLADTHIWPPDDFVEYWAAGKLNLHGENPYSKTTLLPLQREAGRELATVDDAVMMWNPPWTLSVVMPLGALPARLGQFAWLFVHLAALFGSTMLIWSCFHGDRAKLWLPLVLGIVFVPTLFALNTGQISLFLLLGCAGFLWCIQRGYPFWAGVCAVLIAIKPHLAYLFWFAVACDALFNRRWKIVLGGVAGGVVFTAIPMLFNPNVWLQYLEAYRVHPPAEHVSLTLGVPLRIAFGLDRFWLQFLPMIPVLLAFCWHWKQHGRTWNWVEQMPLLVLASFITTPYGAWHFDLVLLLLPMLASVATKTQHGWSPWAKWLLAAFVAVNSVMFAINICGARSYWFAWVAPVLFLLWMLANRPQPSEALPSALVPA